MSEAPTTRRYATRMTPEDRREQLLDATLAIIVREGIHKVSIDAVAREAQVTRPAVYARFRDTHELLHASLDREEAAAMQQVAPAIAALAEGDARDAYPKALRIFLEAVVAAPTRWQAIFAMTDVSNLPYRRRVEQGRAVIAAMISSRLSTASPGPAAVDPDIGARLIVAILWDAGRAVLEDPDRFSPERLTEAAQALAAQFG